MAWWRKKTPSADIELLSALMRGQTEAAAQRTQLEMKRQELELRRMELEFENLERVGEEKRRQNEAAVKLREQKRIWAATARERLSAKRMAAVKHGDSSGCRVCANPGDPSLSAPEIQWHYQGHPSAQQAK